MAIQVQAAGRWRYERRIAGIDAPDRYEFLRIIRTIDLQFLDLLSKRKKTTLAQPKG